ncbi:hypothetical protein HK098_004661 [Nowakowskiella sp. JEL0407]|nr:hypothetical protein HK098_004661 [Nowakowskiella sp. JEL0407]
MQVDDLPHSSTDVTSTIKLRPEKNVTNSSEEDDLITSTSVSVPNDSTAIQPWRRVKREIQTLVSRANPASTLNTTSHTSKDSEGNIHDPYKTSASNISLSIPSGFQISKKLIHSKPNLKSVIYESGVQGSNVDSFALIDAHSVQLIRGSTRMFRIPINVERGVPSESVGGIREWIYIKKWRVIVAASHLQLRLLDSSFELITSVSSVKPVLSLLFVDERDELVAGCVGSIVTNIPKVWGFVKNPEAAHVLFSNPRIKINDFEAEEWISHISVREATNRLYAAVENNVYIYDYANGKRLDCLKGIHELSISALAYHEGLEYLITASRDSTVKVWAHNTFLIHALRGHTQAVTAIVIPAPQNNIFSPFILSCSTDSSICLWSLDNGQLVYRVETLEECIGMEWMRRDTFMQYSKRGIYVWLINRFYSTFAYLRTRVNFLFREERPGYPARIVACAEDNSIRLISPVTGAVLVTAFPVMNEANIYDIVYDIALERIWLLTSNGDIPVYDTSTNPCKIIQNWKWTIGFEKCNCFARFSFSPSTGATLGANASAIGTTGSSLTTNVSMGTSEMVIYNLLFAGTNTGQIVVFDIHIGLLGKQEFVIQAHPAEILKIVCDEKNKLLFTTGLDKTIKVWKIELQTPLKLVNTSMIQIPAGIPDHIALDKRGNFLGLGLDNFRFTTVRVENQTLRWQLKSHSQDEDHTATITKIASLESLRIFATASEDGTVKIWDGIENSMIRELQFGASIYSLCFANNRGDLLVSMEDQIAAVKMQDYLPSRCLAAILEQGDWVDDVVEVPTMFDSSLDFWEIYRQNSQKVEKWHVQKNSNFNASPTTPLFNPELTEEKIEEALKRKRKRMFLKNERTTFEHAKGFEPTNIYTQNTFTNITGLLVKPHSTGAQYSNEIENDVYDDDDDDKDSDSENMLVARNEVVYKEAEYLRISAPKTNASRRADVKQLYIPERPKLSEPGRSSLYDLAKEKAEPVLKIPTIAANGESPWNIKLHPEPTNSQKLMLQKAANLRLTGEQVQEKLLKEVQKPVRPVPPPPLPRSQAKKVNIGQNIQKRMMAMGIVPNSVAGFQEIRQKREEEKKKFEIQERIKSEQKKLEAFKERQEEVRVLIKSRRGNVETPVPQQQPPSTLPNIELSLSIENIAEPPIVKETKPLQNPVPVEPQGRASATQTVKVQQISSNSEVVENASTILPKHASASITSLKDASTVAKETQPATTEEQNLHDFSENVPETDSAKESNDTEEIAELVAPITPQAPQSPIKSPPKLAAKPTTAPKPVERVKYSPKTLPQLRKALDIKPPIPKVNHRRASTIATVSNPPRTKTPIPQKESIVQELINAVNKLAPIKTDSEDSVSDLPSFQTNSTIKNSNFAQESALSWALFKKAITENSKIDKNPSNLYILGKRSRWTKNIDDIEEECASPALEKISKKFWFPGLGGKPVTLTNVIAVLMNLMKTGLWQEKIEASKALLYLYHTFERDFRNPLELLVIPQIEFTHDENPNVRAQVCANLVGYGFYHLDLIHALILRLSDKDENVRNTAKKCLAVYGINSREALREAMIQLRMFVPKTPRTKQSYLDV